MHMSDNYMTVKQAAKFLNTSVIGVTLLAVAGEFKSISVRNANGRLVDLIEKESLYEFDRRIRELLEQKKREQEPARLAYEAAQKKSKR